MKYVVAFGKNAQKACDVAYNDACVEHPIIIESIHLSPRAINSMRKNITDQYRKQGDAIKNIDIVLEKIIEQLKK